MVIRRLSVFGYALAACLAIGMPFSFGEDGPRGGSQAVPRTTAPAAKLAIPVYTVGQVVEVKSANDWEKSKIISRDGDVYQVSYDQWKNNKFFYEWVTVDRIRKPGETRDIPWATSTPHGQKPDREARDKALINLGLANEGATPGQTPADFSGAQEVTLETHGAFTPDEESPVHFSANQIGLGQSSRVGIDRLEGLLPSSAQAGRLGLSYFDSSGGASRARVELVDLKAGQLAGSVALPAGEKAIALSPDAKRVLTVTTESNSGWNGTVVDVYAINGNTLKSIASFTPDTQSDEIRRRVKWGEFIDGSHVLTVSDAGRLAALSIPDMKVIYTAANTGMRPALSKNHKYVAVSLEHGLAVVDALSGQTAVSFPITVAGGSAVFRDDGQQLAVLSYGRIRVFDLVKKEVAADIFLPPRVAPQHLAWVAPNYLLLDTSYLVSISKGAVLWKYEQAQRTENSMAGSVMLGGKLWVMTSRSPGAAGREKIIKSVAGVSLPDAAAVKATQNVSVEDLMVVHPGVKVSLDVQVGNEEGNNAMMKELSEQLKKNGMTVADNQTIRLVARITPDKSHEIAYRRFNSFETTKLTVQDMKPTVSFTVDAKEAWTWSTIVAAPMFASMKQGEGVEQAVAEEQGKAWHAMQGVEIPKMLPAPRETPELGESPLVVNVAP